MKVRLELAHKIRTDQRLVMSLAIRQALEVLQMPIWELSIWVKQQIEQNPLIEAEETTECEEVVHSSDYQELDFEKQNMALYEEMDELFRKSLFPRDNSNEVSPKETPFKTPSLFERLETQIGQNFSKEEKQLAIKFLHLLDDKGFLPTSRSKASELLQCEEEQIKAVAQKIQTFEPIGVGCQNLQEFFLLQLQELGKQSTLAYTIVEDHFDDFLHRRFFKIQQKLHIKLHDIQKIIQKDLKGLKLYPFENEEKEYIPPLIEDVLVQRNEDKWIVTVREEELESFRLKSVYLNYLNRDSSEKWERKFFRQHLAAAKWMQRIIDRRKSILTAVTKQILTVQEEFFLGKTSHLKPLTIRSLAKELDMHESTVKRAIQDKYLRSDLGVHSLKSFLSRELNEEVSSQKAKDILLQLIKQENRASPYSDLELAKELSERGIQIARRTIAKYRKQLKIPNQNQRRYT